MIAQPTTTSLGGVSGCELLMRQFQSEGVLLLVFYHFLEVLEVMIELVAMNDVLILSWLGTAISPYLARLHWH